MNLDDLSLFKQYDPQNMLADIVSLPDQLGSAWKTASVITKTLPKYEDIHQVLICGMGGSAIAGDLVAAQVSSSCTIPIIVLRDYDLPAWVNSHTLVITSSHSGNTEETLTAAKQALKLGVPLIRITTGGKLATLTSETESPCLRFEHAGQPRSAVGYSFAYMLAVLYQQGWISDPSDEIRQSAEGMRSQNLILGLESSIHQNPAKRLAGQMVGRTITIFGSGLLERIARRWKGQINELAKTWAGYDALPEACHNSIAGTENPGNPICSHFTLFLGSDFDHPRNKKRADLLKRHLMLQGFMTDSLHIRGESTMQILWKSLSFGDWTAYYLAMCYQVNPTPVLAIESFKSDLGEMD